MPEAHTLITTLRRHDQIAAEVMCALLKLPPERGVVLVGAYTVLQTCEGSVEARGAAMVCVKALVEEAAGARDRTPSLTTKG